MSERRDTSGPGQALEFEIWSDLIKQSKGALHVFLPLLDRGLDAVLHRFTDGRYIPIQIKGRGQMSEGMVEIVVRGDSLVDDDALLIGCPMLDVPGQLDLVVTERTFKHLAAHSVSQGHEVYAAAFSMHPDHSHWRPYLVPRANLAERILEMSVTEARDRKVRRHPGQDRDHCASVPRGAHPRPQGDPQCCALDVACRAGLAK